MSIFVAFVDESCSKISVMMGPSFPVEGDRGIVPTNSRTLGLGFCQYRRPPDDQWGCPTTSKGRGPRAVCGALDRIMTGVSYATLGRDGQGNWAPSPGYKKNARHMACG